MKRLLWIALAMGLACGCDSGSGNTNVVKSGQKIDVLVSVYPLTDLVQKVGGEWVVVRWLAESGQNPEDLQTMPEARGKASKSALVVTGGPWDVWATSVLSAEARGDRLVE